MYGRQMPDDVIWKRHLEMFPFGGHGEGKAPSSGNMMRILEIHSEKSAGDGGEQPRGPTSGNTKFRMQGTRSVIASSHTIAAQGIKSALLQAEEHICTENTSSFCLFFACK